MHIYRFTFEDPSSHDAAEPAPFASPFKNFQEGEEPPDDIGYYYQLSEDFVLGSVHVFLHRPRLLPLRSFNLSPFNPIFHTSLAELSPFREV